MVLQSKGNSAPPVSFGTLNLDTQSLSAVSVQQLSVNVKPYTCFPPKKCHKHFGNWISAHGTGPSSSVGRVSTLGNGRSHVRSWTMRHTKVIKKWY